MINDMRPKIAALALFATLACSGPGEQTRSQVQAAPAPAAHADPRRVILFLGTSLTAGFGVGVDHAFPTIIQDKIDAAKLPFRVENAGLSGETSAGGLRRLDWSLQQPVDVFVLELGANDGLRGLPVPPLRANLDSILARTRRRYPDARLLIAGMEAPPNMGAEYTSSFRATYRDLAKKYHAVLIPFLLSGVAGKAELNQEDGIHPNVRGHAIVADTVWKYLKPLLKTEAPTRRVERTQ